MLIDSLIIYSVLSPIASWWQAWTGSGSVLLYSAAIIIYAIAVMIMISIFAYIFGWVERKVIAKIHHRHGPTYVGKYGILQNLADIIKLLAKENITPANSDRLLVKLAPILLLAIPTFLILLLPLSQSLQATNLGLGLLIIFVIIAFLPLAVFIAGFATGNKFADISAQRSVLMLVSYELPMVIVVAAIALAAGSFNLASIISAQAGFTYFAIAMPIGLFVFFVAMLAEMERPPFDLREADSELIAGWLTDFSGPYYAIALFIDYTKVFLGSLLIAMLFLGGWLGPVLPGVVWLILKAFIIALFVIIIRAATVRMRIDRILRFGWTWLLPLSLLNLILVYILFAI